MSQGHDGGLRKLAVEQSGASFLGWGGLHFYLELLYLHQSSQRVSPVFRPLQREGKKQTNPREK